MSGLESEFKTLHPEKDLGSAAAGEVRSALQTSNTAQSPAFGETFASDSISPLEATETSDIEPASDAESCFTDLEEELMYPAARQNQSDPLSISRMKQHIRHEIPLNPMVSLCSAEASPGAQATALRDITNTQAGLDKQHTPGKQQLPVELPSTALPADPNKPPIPCTPPSSGPVSYTHLTLPTRG
eukprot:TRINITY_DN39823_c0_g1_i1.p1 TRINITY_DN39823_c0_g1~~TRINITY_DN39823_c0_g1_i1.p1  ORF type:complete len:186 (-),score=38.76 TRINITY_DN39823_c0_g1_i1:52-609(-)